MARGSKIFRPEDVPESNATSYPDVNLYGHTDAGGRFVYTRKIGTPY